MTQHDGRVQPTAVEQVYVADSEILSPNVEDLDLRQLRHSAATHFGEARVPLQLLMAETRHNNPRTAMRYTRPGGEAVAEITGILAPPPGYGEADAKSATDVDGGSERGWPLRPRWCRFRTGGFQVPCGEFDERWFSCEGASQAAVMSRATSRRRSMSMSASGVRLASVLVTA